MPKDAFSGPAMRRYHRWIALIGFFLALYIAPTGIMVQAMDLWALMTHEPASAPTMKAIHVGIYGPPNFQVLRDPDHSAPALPQGFDYPAAINRVNKAARQALRGKPLSFIELRQGANGPVGIIGTGKLGQSFDAGSGAALDSLHPRVQPVMETPSPRNTLKSWHRMRIFGPWFVVLDAMCGLCLTLLFLCGIILYIRLFQNRLRVKGPAPFWAGGGLWRDLHRAIGLVASIFLLIISVTGTLLSISSVGVVIATARNHGSRPAISMDLSRPMNDTEIPNMLDATLTAFHRDHNNMPIKLVRLRYFAGVAQGVVVAQDSREAEQYVYNARTGAEMSLTEPNYPAPGQTFGWQADETLKEIHRGDYFGLPGRWMSLFSAFALLYLTISGMVMYRELYIRRHKSGRSELFWS